MDSKLLFRCFTAMALAVMAGCASDDDGKATAPSVLPLQFVGRAVAEGVFDPSTVDKQVHDVLQVVFRLNRSLSARSNAVMTAAGTKLAHISRYGTTSRCYSDDFPIYYPRSMLARARAGDALPIMLRTRFGELLAETTVIARPLVARPTLYHLAEQMGCRRPSTSQTRPRMTLTASGVSRTPRAKCVNDNTERMRGAASCDPHPRGTLPIRPGEPITIRVLPGKVTRVGLRDFDAKTYEINVRRAR